MRGLFQKTIFAALIAALVLAALPFAGVSAAGEFDPPAPQRQISEERLERIWARQLRIYERMGRADEFVEKTQSLIDRARDNGRDVTAVQAALNSFETALEQARPVYESMTDIVSSHPGFDQDGNVTDAEKAQATIEAMRGKFREIKDVMNGTRRELREAIRAFRENNPPPQPTTAT